ncbi:hypothetical protein AWR27_15265 [Spirosoma montaniterrae]|uniref:Uncharacterized protein n=2 Tax=Spirosoma montaniterrae TaxID=1178516 RepID=A0A1P9WYW3_9BACT|nr:hypothetical protein AWR27_15265 [Spirosoma montaniterrae]
MERIRLLPARSDTPEQPSKLGYQGCRLQTDDQYWSVREGIVRQESPGQPRGFSDPDRQLEKMLLQTAPSAYSALAYSLLSSEF